MLLVETLAALGCEELLQSTYWGDSCIQVGAQVRDFYPMEPRDVLAMAAEISVLVAWVGLGSSTFIEAGVKRLVPWYT